MKKKFLYIVMALCSFSFVACSDDDYTPGKSDLDADRELMTMFRVDDQYE